jgi:hypothetical protein
MPATSTSANIVFFGLGGYICVYLVNDWHWHLVAAALAAGIAISALALLFDFGILRLRGAFCKLHPLDSRSPANQNVIAPPSDAGSPSWH